MVIHQTMIIRFGMPYKRLCSLLGFLHNIRMRRWIRKTRNDLSTSKKRYRRSNLIHNLWGATQVQKNIRPIPEWYITVSTSPLASLCILVSPRPKYVELRVAYARPHDSVIFLNTLFSIKDDEILTLLKICGRIASLSSLPESTTGAVSASRDSLMHLMLSMKVQGDAMAIYKSSSSRGSDGFTWHLETLPKKPEVHSKWYNGSWREVL